MIHKERLFKRPLRDETLSDAMKSFSLAYTKAINKRFNRSGVLFQGRFQSIHILETDYQSLTLYSSKSS